MIKKTVKFTCLLEKTGNKFLPHYLKENMSKNHNDKQHKLTVILLKILTYQTQV